MSDDLTRCPCCEGEGYFYGDDKPPNPWGDAAEIARLRAEVDRLTAALADERAHADALAGALKATAACLDMLPATAIACGADETAIWTAKSAEDYCETLDCAVSAIKTHRARRQG